MNDRLRIAILTQYFWPEAGAPPGRLFELAVRLHRIGHDVTVLTALPSYPLGRIYDGYRGRLCMTEHHEGLRILRAPIYPTQSARFLKRLSSYFSFVFSSILLGALRLGKQDILMVESPPLFLGFAALVLAKLCRARLVFNISDVWPGTLVMGGFLDERSLMTRMAFRLERYFYEHSDLVTGTSPGLIENVRERFPHVPAAVLSNGVDTKWFRPDRASPDLRRELGIRDGTFAVGYCGLHGLLQGLEIVLDAAEQLRDRPAVRFVLVGDGPVKDGLVAGAKRRNLDNILFIPMQPKPRMPDVVASMDAALVSLKCALPTKPVKVYEAMASGVPAIIAAEGEVAEFGRTEGFALVVPPLDGRGLADAVRRLHDDGELRESLRRRGLEVVRNYDRDRIAQDASDLFLRLVRESETVGT
jgi:glycosyltransferase involved in cell wall biosynthesis